MLTYQFNWFILTARRRQPVSTLFQLFFPALLIIALILLKIAMPGDTFDTCQFRWEQVLQGPMDLQMP